MEKHTLVHLTCFSLALAVILGGSTIFYVKQYEQYQTYTEARHQSSLSQLLNSLNQLEVSLNKAKFLPEGAIRQTLAADIWMESQLASAALSSLPLGDQRLEQTETYLAQAGDYAYYLLRSGAYGRTTQEEWDQLCALSDQAAMILKKIDYLKEQADTGNLSIPVQRYHQQNNTSLCTVLSQINDEFPKYASLIYDGPYSDHVSQRTPKALAKMKHYTLEKAQIKAAQLLHVLPDTLAVDYQSEGQIPAYGFSCDTRTVSISRQGALVLALTDSREYGTAVLSRAQAVQKAEAYLKDLGFQNMKHSYDTVYENILTINFHHSEKDILCYSDLIKVGIALDDGSVVRLETSGYAMNHHDRKLETPAISIEDARGTIPASLAVQREQLVYIPTTGFHEVLCWEFLCIYENNQQVLLYINAATGQTENILLLLDMESGTLTQ